MTLQQTILLFFILIYKVKSAARVLDLERGCKPTQLGNVSEEQKDLKTSYTCTGIEFTSQIVDSVSADAKEVIIANSYISFDPQNEIVKENKFESLQSIKISHSFLGQTLLNWMKGLINLESLSILKSSTGYTLNHDNINISTLDFNITSFKNLRRLDISGTNITHFEMKSNISYLNLSDNSFECSGDDAWLLSLYGSLAGTHLNNTLCFIKKNLEVIMLPTIYSLSEKPFLHIMKYKKETVDNCPPKCVCVFSGIFLDRIQLNTDCYGLNMTRLPDVIPLGTSRFNFSHNLIDDLTPVYTNKLYDTVSGFGLSHNLISFLDPVLFPRLLSKKHDIGVDLEHNRLKKFPAAFMKEVYEEAQQKERFMPHLSLSANPFICSCDYIADFQDLVYQFMYDIYDYRDIRCSEDDPYNPGMLILALDVGTLCNKEPNITALDFLNIFLAILLLVIIVDFIYNYHQYKKNRKLPWIVTKFKF